MADQTYNLTQTGAEVQAIINDANGVKGAGATTSLTTDYIMLKDTSGVYHKIQKSSFTEAVRNTLASLLVNNDKGTTISQIAAIASGDFGSVTPANLASVLGGLINRGTISSSSDGTDYTITGYYAVLDNPNFPAITGTLLVFSNMAATAALIVQEYVTNSAGIFMRRRSGSAETWTAWRRIDNFGCNTPSDLASLLGVPANKGSYSGDLNLLKSPGCYFTNHNGTEAQNNSPYPYGRLRVTVYGDSGTLRVLQEIFYIYTGHCKCSLRSANLDSSGTATWSEWFEVYDLT